MSELIRFLETAAKNARDEYLAKGRLLPYAAYIALLHEHPARCLRDASRYLVDLFRTYGSYPVARPWGAGRRWRLFDGDFVNEGERLVGQEETQEEVFRILSGFAREGRSSRLIVLHGPNGSAKSTFIACLMQAMEHFSDLEDGALYTFSWIFPSNRSATSRIGFGDRPGKALDVDSYANLEEDDIDSRIICPVRDHPLALLPVGVRTHLAEQALQSRKEGPSTLPDLLSRRGLCQRCKKIFDALLDSYRGNLAEVLRHVRIERYTISRGYRRGAVSVSPQMSVDASERQLTADQNLASLPPSLSNMTLYEPYGPLVDASGGILEFSDMLKRPLDSYQYLLGTIETGEVPLGQSILYLNTVLFGSTNDDLLDAFKEHPEYASYRGRITLVKVPYLRSYNDEARIYELRLGPKLDLHIAPHAFELAARWAVLSRLKRPEPTRYPEEIRKVVERMAAEVKGAIYADGVLPSDLTPAESQHLRSVLADLYHENDAETEYEGRLGPSPREIRAVILSAAENADQGCLSVLSVFQEIRDLLGRKTEHPFLNRKDEGNGYGDFMTLLGTVEESWLDRVEDELRTATGLVPEGRYRDLFERYLAHVRHWVKEEEVPDPSTGAMIPPDEAMMTEVERQIKAAGDVKIFRQDVMAKIAAFAIENPGKKIPNADIFSDYYRRLKDHYFSENRAKVGAVGRQVLKCLGDEDLPDEDRKMAETVIENLKVRFGYCRTCASEALAVVMKKRYTE